MKLSYASVGLGSYTPLCDEFTGLTPLEEYAPVFSQTVQEEDLAMSNVKFRSARGNVRVQLPVSFNQQYASRDAALDGCRALALVFLAQGAKFNLQFIEGTTTNYYYNAVVADYRPKLDGVSVQHVFSFIADGPTTVPPAAGISP